MPTIEITVHNVTEVEAADMADHDTVLEVEADMAAHEDVLMLLHFLAKFGGSRNPPVVCNL